MMFYTGNKEIDKDHDQIMIILDRLKDPTIIRDLDKRFEIMDVLIHYISDHTRREEGWMNIVNYPRIEDHRQEHNRIQDEFLRNMKDILKLEPSQEIIESLRDLFIDHINVWDISLSVWADKNVRD